MDANAAIASGGGAAGGTDTAGGVDVGTVIKEDERCERGYDGQRGHRRRPVYQFHYLLDPIHNVSKKFITTDLPDSCTDSSLSGSSEWISVYSCHIAHHPKESM